MDQKCGKDMSSGQFKITSRLAIPADVLLESLNLNSVNAELAPWVRMTAPPDYRDKPISSWPVKTSLFSSWVFLFGFLPIDRHHFYMESVGPEGFNEASSSWMNRSWKHRRTITSVGDQTEVTDELEYLSKLPFLTPLLGIIYRAIFQSRHRYLRRRYGTG